MTALLLCLALAGSPTAGSENGIRRLHRRVVATDGVALALYRYRPPGGGGPLPAVLLVPELGFGRESYDLGGEGLANALARSGRDVFVAELRGQGRADHPAQSHLLDVASRDLPAILSAVQGAHPGAVDLVVHGYSGTLALLSTTRELKGRVRRVVALATPVDVEVPNAEAARLLEAGGRWSRAAVGEDAPAVALQFWRSGLFARGVREHFQFSGLSDFSPTLAAELLTWMRTGALSFPDGSTVAARLRDYDRPTLQLLPLVDGWAPPELASRLRERAPAAKVTLRVLSRAELFKEDYTHLSVLQGRDAPADVFPDVVAFLNAAEGATP